MDEPRTAARLRRWHLALALGAAVALGLGAKLYRGPLEAWVRQESNGVFYAAAQCFALLWIRPTLAPAKAAVSGCLASCAVELLQLWHPEPLERVREMTLGRLILGRHFDAWDFPYYALGAALAWCVCRVLPRVR
jgi:hypothetical protein